MFCILHVLGRAPELGLGTCCAGWWLVAGWLALLLALLTAKRRYKTLKDAKRR